MNCLERLFGRIMGADEKIFKHGVFFRILNAVGDSSRVSKNGTGLYLLEFVSKLNLSLPFQNELKGREVLVLWFVRVLGKGFSVNQKFRQTTFATYAHHLQIIVGSCWNSEKDLPRIGYLLGEMIFFGFHESALKVKNRYAIVKDIHW